MNPKKETKVEFARVAKQNGVALVGAPWNMALEEITRRIDKQGEQVAETLNGKRDRVTGSPSHLLREMADGGTSHLRMGKEYTVFSYGKFWLVRGEHEDGTNNTVIYLT